MRMRKPKDLDIIINSSSYFYEGSFFNKNKLLHLEIGIGKGDFLISIAKENKNINFLGIEKNASVLYYAIKKLEEEKLDNVKILLGDVKSFKDDLKNKINVIYLNFSDPWPKARHEKRRLTSVCYLNLYKEFLKKEKKIYLKTDNIDFFNYSVSSFLENNFKIIFKTNNLHKESIKNYLTEYEKKFIKQNIKINYLEAEL